jgi:hypothetical protein
MEGNIIIELRGMKYNVFFYKEDGNEAYSAAVDNDQVFEFWERDTDLWEFTPANEREETFRRQVVYKIINSPEFKNMMD